MAPLDILAMAAHRDDVEQTCGGTLLKMAERGYRTGILDLTRGEMGTRGSAEDREREAMEAARILKTSWRGALDIPDGRVENTWDNKLKVARVLREQRPRVVILPYWKGRHPDHYTASTLGYEACFLAGLKKLDVGSLSSVGKSDGSTGGDPSTGSGQAARRSTGAQKMALSNQQSASGSMEGRASSPVSGLSRQDAGATPHRPFKIIYATLYYDVRPTFVVDITEQFEARFASLMAYKTQFADQEAGKDLFPAQKEIRNRVEAMARFYGMLGGVEYAEPFHQKEVGLIDDLLMIPVKSV
jgi:LmbE family N-acetylglucosaminyl deacetylase